MADVALKSIATDLWAAELFICIGLLILTIDKMIILLGMLGVVIGR